MWKNPRPPWGGDPKNNYNENCHESSENTSQKETILFPAFWPYHEARTADDPAACLRHKIKRTSLGKSMQTRKGEPWMGTTEMIPLKSIRQCGSQSQRAPLARHRYGLDIYIDKPLSFQGSYHTVSYHKSTRATCKAGSCPRWATYQIPTWPGLLLILVVPQLLNLPLLKFRMCSGRCQNAKKME